jgi:hypothetical protein
MATEKKQQKNLDQYELRIDSSICSSIEDSRMNYILKALKIWNK